MTINNYSDFFKGYTPQKNRYIFFKKILKKYKCYGKLLDVGCAHGYFINAVKKDFDCEGIEYNKVAAKIACKKTNCKIYNLSIENAKTIKSNKYDIITCFDVLEHVIDYDSALRNIKYLLKKKGIVVVSVPNKNSLGFRLKKKDWFGYRDKTHVSLLSNNQWENAFKNHKFKVIEKFYEGYFDLPYNNLPLIFQKIYLIPGFIQYKTGIKIIPNNGENVVYILTSST